MGWSKYVVEKWREWYISYREKPDELKDESVFGRDSNPVVVKLSTYSPLTNRTGILKKLSVSISPEFEETGSWTRLPDSVINRSSKIH